MAIPIKPKRGTITQCKVASNSTANEVLISNESTKKKLYVNNSAGSSIEPVGLDLAGMSTQATEVVGTDKLFIERAGGINASVAYSTLITGLSLDSVDDKTVKATTTDMLPGTLQSKVMASTEITPNFASPTGNATMSMSIIDNSIAGSRVKDLAITTAKIANSAVTTQKINDGAVIHAHLNSVLYKTAVGEILNSASKFPTERRVNELINSKATLRVDAWINAAPLTSAEAQSYVRPWIATTQETSINKYHYLFGGNGTIKVNAAYKDVMVGMRILVGELSDTSTINAEVYLLEVTETLPVTQSIEITPGVFNNVTKHVPTAFSCIDISASNEDSLYYVSQIVTPMNPESMAYYKNAAFWTGVDSLKPIETLASSQGDGTKQLLYSDNNKLYPMQVDVPAYEAGNGINFAGTTISAKANPDGGVQVGANGIDVKLRTYSGLDIDTGLGILCAHFGLKTDDGLYIHINPNGGLVTPTSNPGKGSLVDGMAIKLGPDSGLSLSSNGIVISSIDGGSI